ncbi:hypothetical protein GWI33_010113, partial [Rhynchophorus ferrugineus]
MAKERKSLLSDFYIGLQETTTCLASPIALPGQVLKRHSPRRGWISKKAGAEMDGRHKVPVTLCRKFERTYRDK